MIDQHSIPRTISIMIIAASMCASWASPSRSEDLSEKWAHLNRAKKMQRLCRNARDARDWGPAIAYCQQAAEAWATCADDDAEDPYSSQTERDETRELEGGYLLFAADSAWEAGLKREARGFLQSARNVAARIHPSAAKTELLRDIALFSRVIGRP
jgi:hypothetical protein